MTDDERDEDDYYVKNYKKPRLFSPVADGCFGQIVLYFIAPSAAALAWWFL